jgi:hypothetical protein
MEFDWSLFAAEEVTTDEAAESFEDPYSMRFLPDKGAIADQSRFFCLGKSLRGRAIFSIYSATGKVVRVLTSREMTEGEEFFYNRKAKEAT